ncbi:hypothetical protein EDD55_103120 [Varunaivibrio sulfuroxidans]|uniref:Lipid A deacylase LpxR family protein n=2 Tax=Varunaivibrio sulfuroxidans TaxID=1773489 RepID=A0A4R3JC13_9PROT|nr:hypothetical protein EDD55_103120 [Varunaivibrio sulfuroxidans]
MFATRARASFAFPVFFPVVFRGSRPARPLDKAQRDAQNKAQTGTLGAICIASSFFLALLAPPANARADTFPSTIVPFTPFSGSLTVEIENDKAAGTDRHYTHGTRISWVSDDQKGIPQSVRDLIDRLYPLHARKRQQIGFAIGQNIYTPENIASTQLQTKDRPYAGWLYGGISLHGEGVGALAGMSYNVLDTMEIDLGVVGPLSLAKQTQTQVHKFLHVTRPRGWGNQLSNEPALDIILQRKWRPHTPFRTRPLGIPLQADFIPHMGGSLGNVLTHLSAGGTFRLGQNINFDFGPAHIQPALPGRESFREEGGLGWYLFAGGESRLVGRNIFLDGNTFAASHHVDKNAVVWDFQLGMAATLGRYRLTYTQIFRSREFRGQRQPDRYGALSLTAKF